MPLNYRQPQGRVCETRTTRTETGRQLSILAQAMRQGQWVQDVVAWCPGSGIILYILKSIFTKSSAILLVLLLYTSGNFNIFNEMNGGS
jgi:hypothetical protein